MSGYQNKHSNGSNNDEEHSNESRSTSRYTSPNIARGSQHGTSSNLGGGDGIVTDRHFCRNSIPGNANEHHQHQHRHHHIQRHHPTAPPQQNALRKLTSHKAPASIVSAPSSSASSAGHNIVSNSGLRASPVNARSNPTELQPLQSRNRSPTSASAAAASSSSLSSLSPSRMDRPDIMTMTTARSGSGAASPSVSGGNANSDVLSYNNSGTANSNNNSINNNNNINNFQYTSPSRQSAPILRAASMPTSGNNNNISANSHNQQQLQQQQQQLSNHSFHSNATNFPADPQHLNNNNNNSNSNNNNKVTNQEGWTVVETDPTSPGRPPCQRSLHASAVLRDSLYVFGGYDGQNRVNDFHEFHFPTRSWRQIVMLGGTAAGAGGMGGLPGAPVNIVGGIVGGGANGGVIAAAGPVPGNPAGGGGGGGGGLGSQYRPYGATLTATGTAPSPRDRHAAVVHGSTFYVFGGFDGTSRVHDLFGFDVETMVWREVRPRPPSDVGVGPGVAGGGMVAVRGGNAAGGVPLGMDAGGGNRRAGFNNVDAGGGVGNMIPPQDQQQLHLHQHHQQHQLNLDMGDDLRAAPQMARQHHAPPSPRHSHAAVVYNDCMYVFGGYDGSYRSDFHEFDFHQLSWRPIFGSGRSPRARYRSTACVLHDRMILFGGHDGTRHLSDVHTFDFVTQVWTLLMTDGVPPLPRDSHVSVVYKDSMYVFGGSTGSAMNDLHELMFPPSRQALIATDSPAAPDYTTTAYGGNGPEDGGGPSSLPQDGSVTAKWRQIPPVPGGGIAIHRFCHVGAVYNGALYIFGGYDGSSRLNDFVKYDLAADDLFETYIPPPTLLSDLRSFLDDEGAMSLSDITIMVENVPVRAHKLMLMRCPYFRAMLLGDMVESSQSIVSIEIVRHPIFLAVLEYLYTDDVAIPLDSAMELFVAADLFGIPRLQAMCERRLLESITVENAATIFHAADVHSASSLRNKALGYVLSHFEAVSKTTAFEDMARCNVELVFEILKNR